MSTDDNQNNKSLFKKASALFGNLKDSLSGKDKSNFGKVKSFYERKALNNQQVSTVGLIHETSAGPSVYVGSSPKHVKTGEVNRETIEMELRAHKLQELQVTTEAMKNGTSVQNAETSLSDKSNNGRRRKSIEEERKLLLQSQMMQASNQEKENQEAKEFFLSEMTKYKDLQREKENGGKGRNSVDMIQINNIQAKYEVLLQLEKRNVRKVEQAYSEKLLRLKLDQIKKEEAYRLRESNAVQKAVNDLQLHYETEIIELTKINAQLKIENERMKKLNKIL